MVEIGVLALQGDVREHIASLEAAGARAVPVRRSSELDSVDAIVVPGGESTAMWKLAVAFDLLEPLRKRIAAGMPAFGSCAGMIMLADEVLDAAAGQETIGGIDITVRRNAFGRQIDSFEADVEFDGLGDGGSAGSLHAVFIRAPWVERAGSGVQVLARVAGAHGDPAPGRIVAVRQGSLLATSFHPEITRDRRVHAFFAGMVREAAANQ